MSDKKITSFKSPNLNELQEVVIDFKTRIYIPIGANPKEARDRYITRQEEKKI